MKIDLSFSKDAVEEQYGEGYFGRVYRTAILVYAIVAAIVGGHFGRPAFIGLSYGAALSLASLRAIELGVRYWAHPGVSLNRARVSMLMVLKLPALGLVVSGAAWLIVHQLANAFALVGGVALVHAVIFLKALGAALVAAWAPEPAPRAADVAARARRLGAAHGERPAARTAAAGVPSKHGQPAALPAAD